MADTEAAHDFAKEEKISLRVSRNVKVDYTTNLMLKVWVSKVNVLSNSRTSAIKRSSLVEGSLRYIEKLVIAAIEEKARRKSSTSS